LRGCGVGLHHEHHDFVLRERPSLPFFEVITENFLVDGGRPLHVLDRVRCDWPVALHGVSLSPGSAEPASPEYLRLLARLVERVAPAVVSDHLCWTGLGGHNSHDLLPMPFTEEAVRAAAANIRRVQDLLGRRILLGLRHDLSGGGWLRRLARCRRVQRRDEFDIITRRFGAICRKTADDLLDPVQPRQDHGHRVGCRGQHAVAYFAQHIFGRVCHTLQPRQTEEAAGSLDRMDQAEDQRQRRLVGRRALQFQ
jgi:hypothetical protein